MTTCSKMIIMNVVISESKAITTPLENLKTTPLDR